MKPATVARLVHPRWDPAAAAESLAGLWDGASELARADGASWYPQAELFCRHVARDTGRDTLPVIYCLAALSPMVTWSQNCEMTRAMCARTTYKNPGTFPKVARDGWHCLTTGMIPTGAKRRPFALAIAGDTSAVVVDRWMLRALLAPDYSPHWSQMPRYMAAITEFARRVDTCPRDVQAILWCAIRNDVSPASDVVPF